MKLKFRNFVYLLSDFTDLLLKKEREDTIEKNKQLAVWIVVLVGLLILSVTLNIYSYLNY